MDPTSEDILKWKQIAQRRNAILPFQFQFLQKKEIMIDCGKCKTSFVRPLIVAQNDPVYVCPNCSSRNYVPIDWNVVRRKRNSY